VNRNQKENLRRLLTPRHIAFIGGESAVFAAQQCQSGGFKGEIWGVNPKPGRFDSLPCYLSVSDLPEGPDATFLAVPRKAVPRVLTELREKGSGGIVCYSELSSGKKAVAVSSATRLALANWARTENSWKNPSSRPAVIWRSPDRMSSDF